MIIFLVSLFFAILMESMITTIPVVLLIILFMAVMKRSNEVFLIAFLSGLILDILSFGRIGFSSLYFTVLVFLVYMYQRRFEIDTVNFIVIFSFLGSLIYLILDGVGNALIISFVSVGITSVSFLVFRKFNKKIPKYA